MTYYVEILNPKAVKLLQGLADLELISLRPTGNDGFNQVVKRLRSNAAKNLPSLEQITKEVEVVGLSAMQRNSKS